jgi:hypothetical protein
MMKTEYGDLDAAPFYFAELMHYEQLTQLSHYSCGFCRQVLTESSIDVERN